MQTEYKLHSKEENCWTPNWSDSIILLTKYRGF